MHMGTEKYYSKYSFRHIKYTIKMIVRKMFAKPKNRLISCAILFATILLCDYFGLFTHMFEKNYFTEFKYPLNEDIRIYVEQMKTSGLAERSPINEYKYEFISNCSMKCKDSSNDLKLVYLIKSSLENFERRKTIRKSWGFEKRFSDVEIRTVFLLGKNPDNTRLQLLIGEEEKKYGDIVQVNFIDTYYNNTIKTMMGFKWAKQFCPNSKFYFFSDDDMYVSTKNVLRFIRNPTRYPEYLEDPVVSLTINKLIKNNNKQLKQVVDFELPDEVKLYAGKVMFVAPLRHRSSKWYISLKEYPFHLWPPYVTAGSYILSKPALDELYYGSLYTKHFKFDDIFLGIVAKKIALEPLNSPEFKFSRPSSDDSLTYKYIIACHDFDDPNELLAFWEHQREAGNA